MTLEEKIAHLQTSSMEQARAEGNAIIDSHREALEKELADHKTEAMRQSKQRIMEEKTRAKLELNQARAKFQLEQRRVRGKVQQELKDKIFNETLGFVRAFMQTEEYDTFLVKCIRQAEEYAGDDLVTVYINASDADRQKKLEEKTGVSLTVSEEDFIGGVRAVIQSRNILIGHSFRTQLRDEYEKFLFLGGDGVA